MKASKSNRHVKPSASAKLKDKKKKSDLENTKPKTKFSNEGDSDIIDLILRDHKPIKELILILKDPGVVITKKRPAYTEFEKTLSTHAKAEEKSLYMHMKNEGELRIDALEGDSEHAIADQLMSEINQIKNNDDLWMAKVKVLAELVDHHVKEEEKEGLKEVRNEFDKDARVEIGSEYSQLLSQLREERATKTKAPKQTGMQAEYV